MIRKFKAQIVPTVALRSLAAMVFECDRAGWPEDWSALREHARDALHSLRTETDALLALIHRVDEGRGVLTLFADERDEALTTAGIVTASVDFDLRTMLEDDQHGPDALRAFVLLIDRVARSSVYALALRMGTRDAAYDDVLDTLRRHAHERGVLLEVPPSPTAESAPRRERVSASPSGGRIDPSEVFGDGVPRASVALEEELDDEEREFLDEAGLAWPVRTRALEEAWRQVAFAVHPDRRPDDPSASLRFVRLKSGYERLRERAV